MKLNPNFELREVCGEKFLVAVGLENIDFNKLIAFNETGAFLYETAQRLGDFEAPQLVEALTQEYDVTPEVATHDIQNTLAEWQKVGIIA